ncbi:DNA cytosine methyltransferase [Amycolatopsis roodepoortensis]|uniref:DNA cytosine methyltransferase n=1 Tax=Amycolatopsis roodepoortensis TaxID=700274 RepID=UPI00214CBA43|nr:DNA cytosine methyltransferase [Amycolatopsis roodepoortensis]UUV34295.1 DNA cytosine methyltransferase [Amycolatopsis roodepoortensis]
MTSTASGLVVEGFAGPGGWSEGLRLAGFRGDSLGIELDPDAAETATAAGHRRLIADVAAVDLDQFDDVDGVVQSPPCPPWSASGTGRGRIDQVEVADRMAAFAQGRVPDKVAWADPRSPLTAEPLRYVARLRPRWVALEQVPAVLPLWQHAAALLRELGYRTWTGVVAAEQYGVAQTRRRAVLTARLDEGALAPGPHSVKPVSMADVLGWDGAVLVSNYGTGGDPKRRGRRPMTGPAFTMTGRCGRNKWEWPDGTRRNMTVAEAGLLQGFRADYPWSGGSTSRQLQVGNAVPPPLAAAVLKPLLLAGSKPSETFPANPVMGVSAAVLS